MRLEIRWLAWLCLSLMLWTVAVESTHNHANPSADSSCTICVAAHTANPAPAARSQAPVFAAIGVLREENVLAKAQFDLSEAGIRGPPAVL